MQWVSQFNEFNNYAVSKDVAKFGIMCFEENVRGASEIRFIVVSIGYIYKVMSTIDTLNSLFNDVVKLSSLLKIDRGQCLF